jgi:hypothetical protein
MSRYSDINGNTILQLSLPEDKLRIVLQDLHFSIVEKLTEAPFEQKRIIFLVTFREYLKGNFLLEEFAETANRIKMNFPLESRTPEQEDYEAIIYEAADISLYIRKHDNPTQNMFAGFIDGVWNYFIKYRHLLDNLPEKYSTSSPLEKN